MTETTLRNVPRRTALPIVIGLWMAVQMTVIAFTDSVRLWPHHPAPPQSASMVEMIVAQIAAVSLFCRAIDRWGTVFLMVTSAISFGQIAAIDASVPPAAAFRAEVIVGLWIVGARLSQTDRPGGLARFSPAIFAIWVFLPPLLCVENSNQISDAAAPQFFAVGIIDRAIRQLDSVHPVDVFFALIPGVFMLTLDFIKNYILGFSADRPAKSV